MTFSQAIDSYNYDDLAYIPLTGNETIDEYRKSVCKDYWICRVSREVSLISRKEVLNGKAKFGITGDGKELPQIVLARHFAKGDFRSGYYRDQTLVMGLGECTVQDCLAQLYADAENDPFSGGRQMNSHFATPFIDENDQMLDLKNRYNISSDTSSTGGQMARALGLALTSKKIRQSKELFDSQYSHLGNGDEVVFCTIGDASTSEGVFWETLNAAAVTEVPLVISVWDDGYGISVPKKYQTTKASISKAAKGFEINENDEGIYIFTVKGWDYIDLQLTYEKAAHLARKRHKPVLVHVEELTQPQGHSTSGSHERYKDKERLDWEAEHDCLFKMGEWMQHAGLVSQEEIALLDESAIAFARAKKKEAWNNYQEPIVELKRQILQICKSDPSLAEMVNALNTLYMPTKHDLIKLIREGKRRSDADGNVFHQELEQLLDGLMVEGKETYNTHLYTSADSSPITQPIIQPQYTAESKEVSGYEIINSYFDLAFGSNPITYAFGEDVGYIGDVNQGFAGLQDKYGIERIFDTGIREWTIVGQAIGMSMRGLRPIAEIQYLDYLVYGLSPLTDDLACLRYRSAGLQMAPAIIRTRGHRLEGIWHSGSQMSLLLSTLRGMHICVPRNFVQAAGMYQTLLQSTDPAIVVEPLNAYRLKEKLPDNIGTYTIPLGSPDVLVEGHHLTIVTYGSCVPIVMKAATELADNGISVEVLDIQTLLPFDLEHKVGQSLKKTSRLLIVDEDIPGGASAYLLQQILEEQNGYFSLDAKPATLTAKDHRPPYGSEGDYFTKPQVSDVYEAAMEVLNQ